MDHAIIFFKVKRTTNNNAIKINRKYPTGIDTHAMMCVRSIMYISKRTEQIRSTRLEIRSDPGICSSATFLRMVAMVRNIEKTGSICVKILVFRMLPL